MSRNIKPIDQRTKHRNNPDEKLLAVENSFFCDRSFRYEGIETARTLGSRPARVVEEFRSHLSLTLAVAFRRVQQCGQAGSIKLVANFGGLALGGFRNFFKQIRYPCYELKFQLIDVQFLVIKHRRRREHGIDLVLRLIFCD